MIIYAHVNTGYVGCDRREEIEIYDDDIEGMNEQQRNDYIDEVVREWMFDQIEWGWSLTPPERRRR